MPRKPSICDFYEYKKARRKFAAVSCYDYTTARLVAQTSVEMILVGDSAVQFVLGFDSTTAATMDFMLAITAAVGRAAPEKFLVADMPFVSYQAGTTDAVKNAKMFLSQTEAQIVKIEAGAGDIDIILAMTDADVPAMAHIGLRPQTGVLKAQGNTAASAIELIELAEKMIQAGAKMLLVEGTARETAAQITKDCDVPVISCGAGPDCDGQILVIPDILGLCTGDSPKFSKKYASLSGQIVAAVETYAREVIEGRFPDDRHSYHIKPGELEILQKTLHNRQRS